MARKRLAIDGATRSKDLAGRTYIVTGANSGVGLETVRPSSSSSRPATWSWPVARQLVAMSYDLVGLSKPS